MNYGCIGEKLKHSFSKEIHNLIADYDYEIVEIAKEDLDSFAIKKDFKAINVTIPYKEKIMPHLYWIDEHAKLIGSVNTVVNKDGKLYGYNTDFYGMTKLIEKLKLSLENKKVAIFGSGGTSKTAQAVSKSLNAKQVLVVSRNSSDTTIDYQTFVSEHKDTQIIINTTPIGMYPNVEDSPIDLSIFSKLEGVIDAIYNPLRTVLVSQALSLGIPAEGGLYMLVAQAVKASEIFVDTKLDDSILDKTYNSVINQKENVVLTGMPASGKSTVGKIIAKLLGKQFVDTDEEIEKLGKPIPEIIKHDGENTFRQIETDVVKKVSKNTGLVISTGGGAILKEENVFALKQNGRLYFIDRPLELLIPTDDRPLSSNKTDMEKLYNQRYSIYDGTCDQKVDANCTPEEVAKKIIGDYVK